MKRSIESFNKGINEILSTNKNPSYSDQHSEYRKKLLTEDEK